MKVSPLLCVCVCVFSVLVCVCMKILVFVLTYGNNVSCIQIILFICELKVLKKFWGGVGLRVAVPTLKRDLKLIYGDL